MTKKCERTLKITKSSSKSSPFLVFERKNRFRTRNLLIFCLRECKIAISVARIQFLIKNDDVWGLRRLRNPFLDRKFDSVPPNRCLGYSEPVSGLKMGSADPPKRGSGPPQKGGIFTPPKGGGRGYRFWGGLDPPKRGSGPPKTGFLGSPPKKGGQINHIVPRIDPPKRGSPRRAPWVQSPNFSGGGRKNDPFFGPLGAKYNTFLKKTGQKWIGTP